VQVWNADTGKRIFVYDVHKDIVNAVAWSSDGGYLVSGSDDQTVQVWDTTKGYRTFVNCGDSERVPPPRHKTSHAGRNSSYTSRYSSWIQNIAQGYFGEDVHITWGYVVDNATGLVLTPSDDLPL